MFLFYVTAFCILFGSSAGSEYLEKCYGDNLKFPFEITRPLYNGPVYFTPSNGGSRKILMDNGEAKDPRMKSSYGYTRLTDLTDRDEGTFSISFGGSESHDIITLKILDCATEITETYGDSYYFDVPRQSEFLEFTPLGSREQPEVLWNRKDPQTSKGGRGQMRRYSWELKRLTQEDNGFYNFRKSDNTLLSRIRLTVQENSRHYDAEVDKQLLIQYPQAAGSWTVTFTPEGEMQRQTVMKESKLITEDDWMEEPSHHFSGRMLTVHDSIRIDPVEITDSGTFEFRDSQGNLAQIVKVEIKPVVPTFVYVGVIVGIIFMVIVCCCCVRKCCCKKSSSKRDESASHTAAAPAVYYHDENQPAGPSYSASAYSHQPMNPPVLSEPTTTSFGQSVYDPVNIHVSPLQPEVSPAGAGPAPSFGSDYLSSVTEPTFELKGLTFPSAPPLSSDSTFSDVYTSDKLNFL